MITPNPVRSAAGTVYLLEVDGTAAAALALGPALRDLLADERLVACPRCSAAATTVARDMAGRSLPPGELRCGSCEYRWPSPDRDRVAASWRRRAALASAAARAALPRRIARREVELVDAADLEGWARLGIADALLGRSPAHCPTPQSHSYQIAYAAGWLHTTAALAATAPKERTTMTDATPPITPDEASRFAALAMALVAAQTEVASLVRDNSGQHGAYTSSDEVAFVARKALTNNGLAWIRLRVDLEAGKLDTCELGNQYYVGDVVESWVLIHVEGGRLEGSTRMPVISSKGRPQDKAVGASLTYDSGHTLRGLLCLDREDKNHAVDQRRDHDDGQGPAPKPKAPVKPKASKAFKAPEDPFLSKGSKPYTAITAQVKELATLLGEETGDVWAEALRRTAVPPRFDHGGKTIEVKGPGQLRSTQGRFVSVYLTKALGEAVAKAAREAAGEDDEPDFDEALDELDGLVGHPGAES